MSLIINKIKNQTVQMLTPLILYNLKEFNNQYIFEFEIPGVLQENIVIGIENDYLKIKAEKIQNANEQLIYSEFNYGKIFRDIKLPNDVNQNIQPTSTYINGKLRIILQKNVTFRSIRIT